MGLGKTWTGSDDETLCHGWLHASEEPIRGNGRRIETFWVRVSEFYQQKKGDSGNRTVRAITSRWQVIQEAVSKFCTIWAQLSSSSQSRMSFDDQIKNALETYQQTHPKKLAFEYLSCWYILRTAPKWTEICNESRQKKKLRRTSEDGSPIAGKNLLRDDVHGQAVSSTSTCTAVLPLNPNGTKKTKTDQYHLQLLQEQVAAAKQLVDVTKSKVKILQDQVHLNLFSTPDDQIPEVSKRFFELKRAQVMRDLEKDLDGDGDGEPLSTAPAGSDVVNMTEVTEDV